jgi:hypothetical protein
MQVEDEVHLPGSFEGELAHPGLEQVRRVEQAGKVVEDVLRVAVSAKTGNWKAGSLRFGAYDRQVLTNERIQEGRLPHIGGAGKGDVAGLHWHAPR